MKINRSFRKVKKTDEIIVGVWKMTGHMVE